MALRSFKNQEDIEGYIVSEANSVDNIHVFAFSDKFDHYGESVWDYGHKTASFRSGGFRSCGGIHSADLLILVEKSLYEASTELYDSICTGVNDRFIVFEVRND